MSIDSLDNILTKNGFSFKGVENEKDSITQTLWGRPNERFSVFSSPDTISLIWENRYNGYTDVLKKGLGYLFKSAKYFNSLINEMNKIGAIKRGGYVHDKTIVTIFNTEHYEISFSKITTDRGLYYSIRIEDRAYELGEKHLNFDALKK